MREKGFEIEENIGGQAMGVGWWVTRGESESGPGPTRARVPWGKPS